jgi:hypothetical protein
LENGPVFQADHTIDVRDHPAMVLAVCLLFDSAMLHLFFYRIFIVLLSPLTIKIQVPGSAGLFVNVVDYLPGNVSCVE